MFITHSVAQYDIELQIQQAVMIWTMLNVRLSIMTNFKLKVTVESSFFETLNISSMTDPQHPHLNRVTLFTHNEGQ